MAVGGGASSADPLAVIQVIGFVCILRTYQKCSHISIRSSCTSSTLHANINDDHIHAQLHGCNHTRKFTKVSASLSLSCPPTTSPPLSLSLFHQRQLEVYNKRDVEEFMTLFADDCVLVDLQTVQRERAIQGAGVGERER